MAVRLNILARLLDIIYPPVCITCGAARSGSAWVCKDCTDNINILARNVTVPVQNHFESLWALAAYEGVMARLIHEFKYGRSSAANRTVCKLLSSHIGTFNDFDCIVPVPLSWRRYVWRNYNQSGLIAGYVSRLTGKPVFRRAIIKSAHTAPQVGKSIQERKGSLRSAFSVPRFWKDNVEDKAVLLVDDVVTSGTTVDECARVLNKAGAAEVRVLTLAKTL